MSHTGRRGAAGDGWEVNVHRGRGFTGEPEPDSVPVSPGRGPPRAGVIFYEVLTGEHPFDEGETDEELFQQIAHQPPRRPRALNPKVPFGLDKITMRSLRKDPARRYQSGDDLAEELQTLLATKQDWSRPFQTPAKGRHGVSSSRPSTTTSTGSLPLTSRPRTMDGSAAFNLAPARGAGRARIRCLRRRIHETRGQELRGLRYPEGRAPAQAAGSAPRLRVLHDRSAIRSLRPVSLEVPGPRSLSARGRRRSSCDGWG